MLDEADNFLRAEHAADYPNLLPIKSLMEETGWRFKTVFAGLHNVRRMAHAPNSPLPHLGEPICIGPMNQTEANRAALRRLAREPLRARGSTLPIRPSPGTCCRGRITIRRWCRSSDIRWWTAWGAR